MPPGRRGALWIGAIVVGLGAVAAFAIPDVREEHRVEAEALSPHVERSDSLATEARAPTLRRSCPNRRAPRGEETPDPTTGTMLLRQ